MRAWEAVAREPWAITEDWLIQILEIAARNVDDLDAVAAKIGRPLQNTRSVTMRDGVATIPVTGPIFRYANLFTDLSGATSLGILAQELGAAVADPQVKAIVLKLDTPGGQASGVAEFADQVRAASAVKPLVAYVDNMAASAGYWIAAAAPRVVLAKTAHVGSIGVIASVVTDKPRDGSGVYQFVSSQSPDKRIDPSTDEGAAKIQARVDALAAIFIDSVAAFRGVSADVVATSFGRGDLLLPQAAIAAGMADAVGNYEDLIKELATNAARSASVPGARAHSPQLIEETSMSLTLESVKTEHPAIAAALIAEGASAERARLAGIEANILPGYEKLAAECKADPDCTPEKAAVRQVQESKNKSSAYLDTQRANEQGLPKVASVEPATKPSVEKTAEERAAEEAKLPLEERCQATWDRDPALREEYSSFAAYLAFEKANAGGLVKIYSRKE
jgi:ClpP class serine protease